MDDQVRRLTEWLATTSLSRRGAAGPLGRLSVGAAAFGLGLAGVPRSVAAQAAKGQPAPVVPRRSPEFIRTQLGMPVTLDPATLRERQRFLPTSTGGGTKSASGSPQPDYPAGTSGCSCGSGQFGNPCASADPACCLSGYTYSNTRVWRACTDYTCSCNPCTDTCCVFGRVQLAEMEYVTATCCDGSQYQTVVPTYNYTCGSPFTCANCS